MAADKEKDQKDRDWDREMREVDKLLAKLPDADPSLGRGAPPIRGGAGAPGGMPTVRTMLARGPGSPAATWLWLGLGLLLCVGLLIWPYSHVCGAKLLLYILAIVALLVVGSWSAISSWKHRQGFPHLLSFLILLAGAILATGVILPRVGYAGQQGIWLCPEPTTPPTSNR